jgi:pyoverdine/dityrosine biosynthesis protein Dit1
MIAKFIDLKNQEKSIEFEPDYVNTGLIITFYEDDLVYGDMIFIDLDDLINLSNYLKDLIKHFKNE